MPFYRLPLLAALMAPCYLFPSACLADPIKFESMTVEEAKNLAKSEKRFVLVDLFAEWCGPCKWMELNVFTNDSVGSYVNQHFISLRIDAEHEQPDFIQSIDVQAIPTLLVYDPKGRLVFRREGAMDTHSFLDLAHSLVNLQDYYDRYQEDPNDKEVVVNYALASRWINPPRARSIAIKYLTDVNDRRLAETEHWELVRTFVKPENKQLFDRIIENEKIPLTYAEDYKKYLQDCLAEYLVYGREQGKEMYLRQYLKYLHELQEFFPNADSMTMAGKLYFFEDRQDDEWCELFIQYGEKYGPTNAESQAQKAFDISNNYFQEVLLNYALQLADQSIAAAPSAVAYIAKAYAYDRLSNYQAAYANLLLSYEYLEEDQIEQMSDLRQQLKAKSELAFHEGVNLGDEGLGEDGRFTLGVEDKRLMFGYPLPQSTSHFIINIDGELASNAPHLSGVKFIKGLMHYGGSAATPQVITTYEFNGIKLTQELIPVDASGQVITSGFAQYYRIKYDFVNTSPRTKNIGLGLLIDTMVDDNDFCTISADDLILETEYGFLRKNMPSRLSFFRTRNDSTDLMGGAVLRGLDATTPDKLVVGRWPELHQVKWKLNPQKVRYGDSAYFLKWENKNLAARTNRSFVTYFGLPDHKTPKLRMIMHNEHTPTRAMTVYFNHGSSQLDLNAKIQLADMIYDPEIEIIGVLLKGYTDITGQTDYNFELSKRRIAAVGKLFEAHSIPYVPKPYGMEKANSTMYDQQFGNLEDRKVEVEIYYRPASQRVSALPAAQAVMETQ